MKKNKNTKPKAEKPRNRYTDQDKANAKRYYLIGLNMHEIGKLINCPVRTLEKWQKADNWTGLKGLKNIKLRALELHKAGKSYNEISELLKISHTTVWAYIKEAKKANIEVYN